MKCSIEPMKLAQILTDYRKKKGLSQQDLADSLRIPRYTLQRWEKGLVKISPIMFRMLVDRWIIKMTEKEKKLLPS